MEQLKIDIPEGKVPVMEQTEKGVVITWKEKELTYNDIVEILQKDFHNNYIENLLSLGGFAATLGPNSSDTNIFYKKVKVLLKLVNIRNYFGKPDSTKSVFYIYKFDDTFKIATTSYPAIYASDVVAFTEREHAEEAIRILGDELKYLFEPW